MEDARHAIVTARHIRCTAHEGINVSGRPRCKLDTKIRQLALRFLQASFGDRNEPVSPALELCPLTVDSVDEANAVANLLDRRDLTDESHRLTGQIRLGSRHANLDGERAFALDILHLFLDLRRGNASRTQTVGGRAGTLTTQHTSSIRFAARHIDAIGFAFRGLSSHKFTRKPVEGPGFLQRSTFFLTSSLHLAMVSLADRLQDATCAWTPHLHVSTTDLDTWVQIPVCLAREMVLAATL